MKKKASTPHGKTGSKISCTIRCLGAAAVQAALHRLDPDGVQRVPFTCQISGEKEELLLFGHRLATLLAANVPEAGDADGASILAGLYGAELCECDVATLTGLAEDEVVERLRALTARGLLAHRILHGMHYFRLQSEDARHAIAALLPN